MMPTEPPPSWMLRILITEVAGAAVDENDFACQAAGDIPKGRTTVRCFRDRRRTGPELL